MGATILSACDKEDGPEPSLTRDPALGDGGGETGPVATKPALFLDPEADEELVISPDFAGSVDLTDPVATVSSVTNGATATWTVISSPDGAVDLARLGPRSLLA